MARPRSIITLRIEEKILAGVPVRQLAAEAGVTIRAIYKLTHRLRTEKRLGPAHRAKPPTRCAIVSALPVAVSDFIVPLTLARLMAGR